MWKLFPISPGSKTPALEGDWRKHATSDPEQVEAWRDAGYSLAVDCGASGLLVIDIDGEEGLATAAGMDLPPTYTMRTPRGGKHLYYTGAGPTSVQKLGLKVDTRGEGGYVVWEGPGYEPVDEQSPKAQPAWVLPALNMQKDRKASATDSLDLPVNISRAEQYLSIRAPAIEGEGGNDHTYRTAAAVRDLGLSADRALDLMLEGWNERCLPPWDAEDLQQVVDNAYRYGQNEESAQAFDFDPKTRFSDVEYDAPPVEEKPSRFRLWSLDEAAARPKPTFLFDGVLPARSFGVAYGPMENGKTWLLIDMALRVAMGWDLSGQPVNSPRDVVFFAGEGLEDIVHSRCRAWCEYHGLDRNPERFHLMENFPNVTDEDEIDEMVAEIRKRCSDVALILVDTYARAMAEGGLSENDPLEVMKFVRQMEVLKRGFGCSVLAVHHSGKDMSLGARGSNSLMAAADFGWEITAEWSVNALQLKCAKMKAARRFDPLYYEALARDESLVLRGITASAYHALTRVEDSMSSRAIGAALAKLGATGPEKAVTAYVLASALYTAQIGEPEAEVQAATDRLARKLSALGKGRLEQYVSSAGWSFPE